MSITATLKVVLLANEVPVAESEDAALWQHVLGRINGTFSSHTPGGLVSDAGGTSDAPEKQSGSGDPVAAFASQLGVNATKVLGACSPKATKPYLHLDAHFWAAFRTNFSSTGRNAVSGTVLAATLLVLWRPHAGIERITSSDVQGVLETVNGDSSTIARSVQRCSWLQLRDDQIQLNPAEIARAELIARAFCLKQPENAAKAQ
jgi:hypothetical protein